VQVVRGKRVIGTGKGDVGTSLDGVGFTTWVGGGGDLYPSGFLGGME
jgi:hypothetical protein